MLGPKKILVKNFLGAKQFWVKKILGTKDFESKKNFGQNNFLVKKMFGPKKSFDLKNCWPKRILGLSCSLTEYSFVTEWGPNWIYWNWNPLTTLVVLNSELSLLLV